MSNIRAISGSSKITNRNQGGGSKLQGMPSSRNLNTSASVAFRNRNVLCACKKDYVFCMNQLGGVGAGGIPGRSYAFAPSADSARKFYYCGHHFGYKYVTHKHLNIHPTQHPEPHHDPPHISSIPLYIPTPPNIQNIYNLAVF